MLNTSDRGLHTFFFPLCAIKRLGQLELLPPFNGASKRKCSKAGAFQKVTITTRIQLRFLSENKGRHLFFGLN